MHAPVLHESQTLCTFCKMKHAKTRKHALGTAFAIAAPHVSKRNTLTRSFPRVRVDSHTTQMSHTVDGLPESPRTRVGISDNESPR